LFKETKRFKIIPGSRISQTCGQLLGPPTEFVVFFAFKIISAGKFVKHHFKYLRFSLIWGQNMPRM
jgi:hypothetical protein